MSTSDQQRINRDLADKTRKGAVRSEREKLKEYRKEQRALGRIVSTMQARAELKAREEMQDFARRILGAKAAQNAQQDKPADRPIVKSDVPTVFPPSPLFGTLAQTRGKKGDTDIVTGTRQRVLAVVETEVSAGVVAAVARWCEVQLTILPDTATAP